VTPKPSSKGLSNGSQTSTQPLQTSQISNNPFGLTVQQPKEKMTLGNGSQSNIGYRDTGLNSAFKENINGPYTTQQQKSDSKKIEAMNKVYSDANDTDFSSLPARNDIITDGSTNRTVLEKFADDFGISTVAGGFDEAIYKPLGGLTRFVNDGIGAIYKGITGDEYLKGSDRRGIFGKLSDDAAEQSKRVTDINDQEGTTVAGDVARGVAHTLPLILGTMVTAGAAAEPQIISGLTKYLAGTGALNSYEDSREKGDNIGESLKEAGKGGVIGAAEGITLDAQMMLGKAFGKGAVKALAEKGLFAGGKATEAALQAIGVGATFAGSSIGKDLLNGEDINWKEASTQLGMGLAFEAGGILGGIKSEVKEAIGKDKIDKSIIKNIADKQEENKINSFLNATPEQVVAIHDINKTPAELFADSVEQGVKAVETDDYNDKRNGHIAQVALLNASNIKQVTESIAKDPTKFVEAINATDMPAETKSALLQKVDDAYRSFNPLERQKKAIADEITSSEQEALKMDEMAKNSSNPVEQVEFTNHAKNATEQASVKRMELEGIVDKQMGIVQTPQSIDVKVESFQKNFPNKIPDLMEDLPVSVVNAVERIDLDKPLDVNALDEASNWLYEKYKSLTAMKKSDSRMSTTKQIENVQVQIEKDITSLAKYKEKLFVDKTEGEKHTPKLDTAKPVVKETPKVETKPVDTAKVETPVKVEKPVERVKPTEPSKEYFDVYEDIVKNSESLDEAFDKAKSITGVNSDVSDTFRKKYDPTGELTSKQAFEKFYDEVKPPEAAVEAKVETVEEKLKDIVSGDVVTFKYDNKKNIPNIFKDRITSESEINGVKTYRVTMSKIEADRLLKEQKQQTTAENKPAQVRSAKLEVNQDLKDNGISLRAVELENGKLGIFEERDGKIVGKSLGRFFESADALEEAYNGGIKDKLTAKSIIDSRAPEMVKEAKSETTNLSTVKTSKYDTPVLKSKATNFEVMYIPREIQEKAYINDKDNNTDPIKPHQTLDRIIERGGYSVEEISKLLPEWKDYLPNKKSPVDASTEKSSIPDKNRIEKAKAKVESAKSEFDDFIKQSRGSANSFADVGTFIAKATKLMAAYAELGIVKLDDVLKKLREDYGDKFVNENQKDLESAHDGLTADLLNSVAEKSPDDIAAENIAEFKKRLEKVLSKSKVTTLIKTGVVSSDIATKAMKSIASISDRKTMLEASRNVKKVFENVIKNAYRSQVQNAKKNLKLRFKNTALIKTDLIKKFSSLDEKTMDQKQLEEYTTLIRKLNDQYNGRLDGLVADAEIQKFVDKIADSKAKDILKEQLGDAEVVEEAEGSKEESPRRKQLKAIVALNRQELRKGGYSEEFKPVAQALNRIDVEKLGNGELRDLNLALINLAVNDRLVGHDKVFTKYVGQTGMEDVQSKVGDKIKGLLESEFAASARSLDVNTKIIFKGVKDASLFQQATGIEGISSGNSQVGNIDMKAMEKKYDSLLKKLDFDKDGNTAENRFLRGLYSNATQYSSIENEAADFKRYKGLLKQSYEKLENSDKSSEKREGALRKEQFEQYLEPFDNRADFEANFKKEQPQNVAVVDFFREQFANKFPELRLNSQIYAGKDVRPVNNYLPIKYKAFSGTEKFEPEAMDIVEPTYIFDPETGDVSEKQSSTTIERTKNSIIKDNGRILDMDFDRNMFDKYREMNYDIRTLKFRHLYNSIRSQEGFKDVVGSRYNADILTKSVGNMVKRQMGANFNNDVLKPVVKASRILSAKGVRQALFGVSQVAKQYPSVAIRTMLNLNTDAPLFFRGIQVGRDNPIFNEFGIGLRSTTKGGTQYEAELNNIRKSDFSSSPAKLIHAIDRVTKSVTNKLSNPLSYSDDSVAKHSWIAYYLQDIKNRGGDISKIDWENEHLNPDREAGAYADLMTSTTQNVNDNTKQADLLYDNGDSKTLIRDVALPFSSFARNSQANLETDLRNFSGGTTTEKKNAAWGIISTVAEQAAFNTIKVLVVGALVKGASNQIQKALGMPTNEDKSDKTDKIIKNTTSDILFSGLGSLANYWAIAGVNKANSAIIGAEKDLFFQYDPSQYGEPDFAKAGIYGILPQNIYNMSQKADYMDGSLEGEFSTRDSKGRTKNYKAITNLTDKEQKLVTTLFFMDALALVGLSDAEVSRVNQTIFRDVKKRTEPVKSFKIKYANKKGGAIRERQED
jgi:hypothetical protein